MVSSHQEAQLIQRFKQWSVAGTNDRYSRTFHLL